MSKAAVNSFTRSIAVDLGRRGITVNAVAPGAINTDFIRPLLDNPELAKFYANQAALGRIGESQDVAGVVAFLASPTEDMSQARSFRCPAALIFEMYLPPLGR